MSSSARGGFWDDREAVHQLYRDTFRASARQFASFDLITGILRISMTAAELRSWIGRLRAGDLDRETLEVFHHEGTHFMQAVTCGYLFFMASRLFEIVHRSYQYMEETGAAEPMIAPGFGADLLALVGHLDAAGEGHLTPRTIIESATFHTQKRSADPSLNAASYAALLDRLRPPGLYRDAYDVAAEVIGEAAFGCFQFISYRALCSRDPVSSFVAICQEVARRKLRLDSYERVSAKDSRDLMPFVRAADHAVGEDHIGGPNRILGSMQGQFVPHRVYLDAMANLAAEQARDESLDLYTIAPHLTQGDIQLMLRQPVLLDQADAASREWHLAFLDSTGRRQPTENYRYLIAHAALGARLAGQVLAAGYKPPTRPELPPEAVASSAGWAIRSAAEVQDRFALATRFDRLQYVVLPAADEESAPSPDAEVEVTPEPGVVDYLRRSLGESDGGFVIEMVRSGEPRRKLLIARWTPTALFGAWLREKVGQRSPESIDSTPRDQVMRVLGGLGTPDCDARFVILPGRQAADDEAALAHFQSAGGIDLSELDLTGEPVVLVRFDDEKARSSANVHSLIKHLAIALVDFLEAPLGGDNRDRQPGGGE